MRHSGQRAACLPAAVLLGCVIDQEPPAGFSWGPEQNCAAPVSGFDRLTEEGAQRGLTWTFPDPETWFTRDWEGFGGNVAAVLPAATAPQLPTPSGSRSSPREGPCPTTSLLPSRTASPIAESARSAHLHGRGGVSDGRSCAPITDGVPRRTASPPARIGSARRRCLGRWDPETTKAPGRPAPRRRVGQSERRAQGPRGPTT